jgi:hypothetical protein
MIRLVKWRTNAICAKSELLAHSFPSSAQGHTTKKAVIDKLPPEKYQIKCSLMYPPIYIHILSIIIMSQPK